MAIDFLLDASKILTLHPKVARKKDPKEQCLSFTFYIQIISLCFIQNDCIERMPPMYKEATNQKGPGTPPCVYTPLYTDPCVTT